jgi:serine/threonine protein kinase
MEIYKDKDRYYFVMKKYPMGDLHKKIYDKDEMAAEPFPEKRVAHYMEMALKSIAYCHDVQVVHRDIKP